MGCWLLWLTKTAALMHSSWSGGSCVCAHILLQDEWLWALSKESKAQLSPELYLCDAGLRWWREDRWGMRERQLWVQNWTCDDWGCSSHHLWLSRVQEGFWKKGRYCLQSCINMLRLFILTGKKWIKNVYIKNLAFLYCCNTNIFKYDCYGHHARSLCGKSQLYLGTSWENKLKIL